MNPRSFYKLLIITTFAFIAAVTVWIVTPKYSTGTFFGEPLLPGLLAQINDVEVVSIEHSGKTLTFMRDNSGGWTLMEANGYPADKERIRNALIGLSHLEKIEPKTALPEFYPELQVEDNAGEKSKSYLVTLLNTDGEQLTSLLIGKNISGVTWNGQGYFVRFPNDPQSWLVRGNVDVTGDQYSWMSARILPLIKGRISSVTVVDGTKTREAVYKRTDPTAALTPTYLSDKHLITAPDFIEKMEQALTSFDFEEAIARPENLADEVPFSSSLIETGDGLSIYLFLYLLDSNPYVAVVFTASDNADQDVRKEIAELEALHGKWLYRMPSEKILALLPFLSVPEEKEEPKKTEVSKEKEEKKTATPKAPQPKKATPDKTPKASSKKK